MRATESSTTAICIFVKLKECCSDYVKGHTSEHFIVLECQSGWANGTIDSIGEAQRGEVTCTRSHSKSATDRHEELEMLTPELETGDQSSLPPRAGRPLSMA